nr:reverse transcriptase domain-containing protein [Tanacetum cinerariifolium]
MPNLKPSIPYPSRHDDERHLSALKPNQRPLIPYPSRLHDQKLREKANDQKEKFFQIIKDLNFNISFIDALILMPKFGPTIKTSLTNKDKLSELARTSLNEHCLAVLLKKLPEKLEDPGKFLIPCDFPRMAECLALADLNASINLMPLLVWNKLLLPDLSPTCMTLEITDHSISQVDAFLAIEDDPTSPEVDQSYVNTKGDILLLEAFLTRSGTAYQGPTIPTTSSSLPPIVEHETEATKDTVPLTNNRSTKNVQPLVVQTETLILNFEPVVAPIIEPVVAPVSALKPNQ